MLNELKNALNAITRLPDIIRKIPNRNHSFRKFMLKIISAESKCSFRLLKNFSDTHFFFTFE